MRFHPPVHCIVTGGGLALDQSQWLTAPPFYLFPIQAIGKLFRGKFMAGLQELLRSGKLHANGNDPAGALDLAKTLGGALALGRAAARAQGKDDLASFLDYASVRPSDSGSFWVEMALPLDSI